MAVLDTGDLTIPTQILEPWLGKVQNGSAVATLSNSIPMRFGAGSSMTFDIGEAELVAEGANKGASTVTPTTKTVAPFKLHKTVRFTEEVLWADEDYQLGVVSDILNLIQPSLSRGLDFIVFHGINPADGAVAAAITESLNDTTNTVELTAGQTYEAIDAADALVLADGYVPSDIALDPTFAAGFSAKRTDQGIKLYPELQLTTAVSNLEGHRSSVSNTVGAIGVAAVATNAKAFVGDFSAIRWGVQKQIGLELIRYGDPDGQGDLKRNNQVAFRAEVVYGFGIATLDAFAEIIDAV